MGARSDERQQSAYAQMCGVQFGIAAAENLGLLQAAQRENGGSSFLAAFAPGDRDRRRRHLENEPDDPWLAGRIGVVAGNGYSNCLCSHNPLLSEKSPFFNGLLGSIGCVSKISMSYDELSIIIFAYSLVE